MKWVSLIHHSWHKIFKFLWMDYIRVVYQCPRVQKNINILSSFKNSSIHSPFITSILINKISGCLIVKHSTIKGEILISANFGSNSSLVVEWYQILTEWVLQYPLNVVASTAASYAVLITAKVNLTSNFSKNFLLINTPN